MTIKRQYVILILILLYSAGGLAQTVKQEIKDNISKGLSFSRNSEFDSSIYFFDKALLKSYELDDQINSSYINKLIGTEFIFKGEYDSALIYLNESNRLAEKLNNDTLLAMTNSNMGYIMLLKGKTDSAEYLLKKSLKQYRLIPDTVGMAKAYNLLTILYKYTSDFDKGIETALKSYSYFKKFNQIQSYIRSLINLGNIYEKLGEYDTAYSCYQICQALSFEHDNPAQALTALINMAVIDYNRGLNLETIGDDMKANEKFLKSKENYIRAIEVSTEINDKQTLSLCYSNMSNLYWKFEQHNEAINSSTKALGLAQEIGDVIRQIHAITNLGISYINIGEYKKAESYLIESLDLATKLQYKEDQRDIMYYLSTVYAALGNYKQALDYHRQAALMQDSILNEVKIRAIKESEAKFELIHLRDKNRIAVLEKKKIRFERNLSLGLGIGLIILLTLLLILFRMRARKNRIIAAQKIQKLEDEKKLMAAQSVMVGQEKERERIARELHDGIGVLLSTASIHFSSVEDKADDETSEMLRKANKLLKDAGKEVRQISHNMMPGVLSKFGLKEAIEDLFEAIQESDKIHVDLQLTCGKDRLAENMEIMLYRVIQEMLNNTLKHAKANNITLIISRNTNDIFIDYIDDGIGFDEAKLPHGKNLGISGIRSRIEYLGGTLELSSKKGKGTTYSISIPLSEKIGRARI